MDQMVSSVGGFVFIDFQDTVNPVIESHSFNFEQAGYCICITDTKGSHADLTDDYVSIPVEMKHVAKQFGKEVLRDVDENDFYAAIPKLRSKCTDREILRAAHFFGENKRAKLEAEALEQGDIDKFFALVRSSADSSANLLQNLYSCKKPTEQGIPLAIMMSRESSETMRQSEFTAEDLQVLYRLLFRLKKQKSIQTQWTNFSERKAAIFSESDLSAELK